MHNILYTYSGVDLLDRGLYLLPEITISHVYRDWRDLYHNIIIITTKRLYCFDAVGACIDISSIYHTIFSA